MTPKEKYRKLCISESSIPLYSRDWWLDVVCAKKWDVIIIEEKEEIKATLPYYMPAPGIITMPFYTQTMGIWCAPSLMGMKPNSYQSKIQTLSAQLIESLPTLSFFLQNFSYSYTDWLPFYWEGFKQTTRYTYILDNITDKEILWSAMSSNTKRNIIRAKEKFNLIIKKDIPVEEFIQVQEQTYKRQNISYQGSRIILERLIEETRSRGDGATWGAYGENGELHAAIFVVWQKSSAYYIAGGGNPDLRNSGAHALLMWEAIQYCSQFTGRFDFEGSMIPGVERFFREFGGKQTPFFTISKSKMSLFNKVCLKLRRKL